MRLNIYQIRDKNEGADECCAVFGSGRKGQPRKCSDIFPHVHQELLRKFSIRISQPLLIRLLVVYRQIQGHMHKIGNYDFRPVEALIEIAAERILKNQSIGTLTFFALAEANRKLSGRILLQMSSWLL